jgi:NADPH:quinone reductase-like Zn-dependent oxidoreductase
VGTAALQLIRAIGARSLGTTRQAGKLAALEAHGLRGEDGIVVENGRFAGAVMSRTGNAGAPVILDCIGAAYLEENLRALATRGRLVLLGTMGGATGPAPIGMLLGKRATMIGTVLRARPLEEKMALARLAAARLVPMFERGLLAPVIDVTLPMTAGADAHARMEQDQNIGKIVLRWE